MDILDPAPDALLGLLDAQLSTAYRAHDDDRAVVCALALWIHSYGLSDDVRGALKELEDQD